MNTHIRNDTDPPSATSPPSAASALTAPGAWTAAERALAAALLRQFHASPNTPRNPRQPSCEDADLVLGSLDAARRLLHATTTRPAIPRPRRP